MDRAGQASFAWSLLDAATPVITDESRAWLATKIGAGELEGAIVDLLRHLEFHRRTLTAAVHGQAQTWLNGYLGDDREAALRTLVDRIRIT